MYVDLQTHPVGSAVLAALLPAVWLLLTGAPSATGASGMTGSCCPLGISFNPPWPWLPRQKWGR